MPSLYNLSAEYQKLLEKEEYTAVDLMEIDKLHDTIQDRIVYYANIIQDLRADLAGVKSAIESAVDKKQRIQTNINRLEEYITATMISSNITLVDNSPFFDVKMRNNPVSVDDYAPTEIPEKYWVKKEEFQLDKNKVKEDIESGVEIPGVRLQRKVSLQIK